MGGRRGGLLVVLAMLIVPLSGCLGADTAEWGSETGQLTVDVDGDDVTIDTKLTGDSHTMEVSKYGCGEDNDVFRLEGWLPQFHHYPQGADEPGEDDDLLMAVTVVVIIELMEFEDAKKKVATDVKRVDVKDFGDPMTGGKANPLSPKTLGEPKLDKNTGFMTLGLIPSTENIQYGMAAIEWHLPVKIEGYFLTRQNGSNIGNALKPGEEPPDSLNCRLSKGPGNEVFLVTKMTLGEDKIVTMSGDHADEWVNGDVPILGRWLYIVSLLALGGGGAFGLFIVSMTLQRKGAAAAASMLLGEDRVMKAKSIKQDVKEAREDGLEISTTKRKKERRDTGVKLHDSNIKGFSLDNVLGSGPSISASAMEVVGGGVVVTDEAIDMEEKMEDLTGQTSGLVGNILGGRAASERTGGGPPRIGGVQPFTQAGETSTRVAQRDAPRSEQQARSRGPPRQKRAVREQQPAQQQQQPQQQQPSTRQRRPSMTDDDDFSDFS